MTKYPTETGLQTIFQDTTADTSPTYLIAKETFKDIIDRLEEISKDNTLAFLIFREGGLCVTLCCFARTPPRDRRRPDLVTR